MFLIPFQHGLTALHIACKKGRKGIVCELVAKARTQKNFCFKRNVASDYEVAVSAKGRHVCWQVNYLRYLTGVVPECVFYLSSNAMRMHNTSQLLHANTTNCIWLGNSGNMECCWQKRLVKHVQRSTNTNPTTTQPSAENRQQQHICPDRKNVLSL